MNKERFLRRLCYLKAFGYEFSNEYFLTDQAPNRSLSQLNSQIKSCNLCELCKSKNHSLVGIGNANSKVIFVLDSPSELDDKSGNLLSGAVGEKFYDLIKTEIKDENFYVTTLIKCKKNGNAPIEASYDLCRPYLECEVKNVSPKVVVALGEEVFYRLSRSRADKSFESIRGNAVKSGNMLLVPTYSPFWVMQNPSKKEAFLLDLNKIRRFL